MSAYCAEQSNGSISHNGRNFTVQCGRTVPAGDFVLLNPEYPVENNYSATADCVNECASNSSCFAVTGNASNCTLLANFTDYVYNNNSTLVAYIAWEAGLNAQVSSMNTSTAVTTTPPSSPSTNITTTPPSSPSTNITTTPPSSPSTNIDTPTGISTGIFAGVVVGAAIGAALLASLLTFLLCIQRNRRRHQPPAYGPLHPPPAQPWQPFLPQSADDSKISNAVATLCSQIDQHVENFYTRNHDPAMLDRSRGYLGIVDSERLRQSVETLLPEVRDSLPVIKHCFAWYILRKLSPSASAEDSLLPPVYGQLPSRLAGGSKGRAGEEEAAKQAYDYWRRLTAYLMYPTTSGGVGNSGSDLGPAGTHTIDVLTMAFKPWASSAKGGPEHLGNVLRTAFETGALVLSQPSRFTFDWDVSKEDNGSTIVVSPAFVKTADEHGDGLSQPQILVEPKLETMM